MAEIVLVNFFLPGSLYRGNELFCCFLGKEIFRLLSLVVQKTSFSVGKAKTHQDRNIIVTVGYSENASNFTYKNIISKQKVIDVKIIAY